jgi:hypothetical protein
MIDSLKTIRGFRPLSVCTGYVLWAKGYSIYVSDHQAQKFDWVCDIPVGWINILFSHSRILQRLMRLEVYSAVQFETDEFIVSTRGKLWHLNVQNKQVTHDHSLRVGSRPLSLLALRQSQLYQDGIYYGEYSENLSRDSVEIYHRNIEGSWSIVYSFPVGSIEHVHSLIENPETGEIWVLTGDFDGGSGFWVVDRGFTNVRPLLLGSQEYRCAWASWRGEKAYFATDSQRHKNSFRYINNDGQGWKTTTLAPIYGSSIYSAITNKWLAFSTAVEPLASSSRSLKNMFDSKPGPGILGKDSYVYLWRNKNNLEVLFKLKKDWLPPTLFQFGTVIFPDYCMADSDFLYCYCVGLKGYDGCTVIKNIS